ncbi:EamA domain [Arabidopsis suecica]|uniref:WAT1-related protein n=1 Tax=Arabidopsis suecica TaxID=45249 RepID=A0A8T1XPX2_ARASU|nr:EamA domain [Arabidopsis suecica]
MKFFCVNLYRSVLNLLEERMKKEMIEEMVIVGGLVMVQFVYAGNSLLMSYLMSLGLGPFTIVIFSTFATFIILSPFAILFERKQWPNELSLRLICKLVLISFAGVTLFQSLFLEGIRLTSPAMATAMPNLAPGLIFFIAWIVGLEKMNLKCVYSKLKILGTLLCVFGALTMSIMHSTSISHKEEDDTPIFVFDRDKVVGCIYLLGAVFVLSTNVVLQASTLAEFPAPISLSAITALLGVLITTVVLLLQNRKARVLTSSFISFGNLVGYSVMAGSVSGACVSFNGWAMKKRGPVLVSMFSPFATVISVAFSVLTLGESVSLGSVGGMVLMFVGLYLVLWAKGKEGFSEIESFESEFDSKKPLLS